jgi:hypothetical protein
MHIDILASWLLGTTLAGIADNANIAMENGAIMAMGSIRLNPKFFRFALF